jgi:hypothetical protein
MGVESLWSTLRGQVSSGCVYRAGEASPQEVKGIGGDPETAALGAGRSRLGKLLAGSEEQLKKVHDRLTREVHEEHGYMVFEIAGPSDFHYGTMRRIVNPK